MEPHIRRFKRRVVARALCRFKTFDHDGRIALAHRKVAQQDAADPTISVGEGMNALEQRMAARARR
jgi:hypothetical protein